MITQVIEWKGNNLREVIDYIGRNESAMGWSWDHFEQVVKDNGLKIFTRVGSVIVDIGDSVGRNPDGSVFVIRQSEEAKQLKTLQQAARDLLDGGPDYDIHDEDYLGAWFELQQVLEDQEVKS